MKPITKDEYRLLLKDPRWIEVKNRINLRDGWRCKDCGDTYQLDVHHMLYIGHYPWETPDEFLATICRKCHNKNPPHVVWMQPKIDDPFNWCPLSSPCKLPSCANELYKTRCSFYRGYVTSGGINYAICKNPDCDIKKVNKERKRVRY